MHSLGRTTPVAGCPPRRCPHLHTTNAAPPSLRSNPGLVAPLLLQHSGRRSCRIAPNATAGSGGPASHTPPGGSDGPPTSKGGSSGGSNDGHHPQPRHSLSHWLAAAAAAHMLLALWQPWRLLSGLQPIDTSAARVSIIIPVLNESGGITATLEQLQQLQPAAAELIVVDGGSTDGTFKLVRQSGLATKVIKSSRGRAAQMNAGAEAATGELLCFLHADTQPPKDLVRVMRQTLRDPHTVLVGFVPSIEVPKRRLWLLSFHNFISTYYAPLLFRPLGYMRGLRNLFGDQTLFCRGCDFKAVGGFDTRWAIMEDTDLCVRMHQAGPCLHHHSLTPAAAHQPQKQHKSNMQGDDPAAAGHAGAAVQQQWWQQWWQPRGRVKQVLHRLSVTSGRRLEAWGTLRATYIHFVIGINWYFQQDPEQLRALYKSLYTDAFR